MRLLEVLDLSHLAADPAYFSEPLDPNRPVSFVRSVDPARLKAVIAERLKMLGADDLEERLATCGVPAARVRKLGEFAAEALQRGQLSTVALQGEDASVISPGLGFGARMHL